MTDIMIILAGIVLAITVILLARRVHTLSDTLDRVRMATYELTTSASDEIKDLQDTLNDHGIPLVRTRANERMRRMALTPEERHAESMKRWEDTVAQVEDLWD
jgi:hypothetical protein